MQCTAPPPEPGTEDAPTGGEHTESELPGQQLLSELPGWTPQRPTSGNAGVIPTADEG